MLFAAGVSGSELHTWPVCYSLCRRNVALKTAARVCAFHACVHCILCLFVVVLLQNKTKTALYCKANWLACSQDKWPQWGYPVNPPLCHHPISNELVKLKRGEDVCTEKLCFNAPLSKPKASYGKTEVFPSQSYFRGRKGNWLQVADLSFYESFERTFKPLDTDRRWRFCSAALLLLLIFSSPRSLSPLPCGLAPPLVAFHIRARRLPAAHSDGLSDI